MSYYRAALAAANSGDLTGAFRLANIAIALEISPSPAAIKLQELLKRQIAPACGAAATEPWAMLLRGRRNEPTSALGTDARLAELIKGRRYKEALKTHLPESSKARTIRGLLYAASGKRRRACAEFIKALSLDSGNDTARRALIECSGIKQD